MNVLTEKGILTEMECGSNVSYVLKDNSSFLSTEYKVLQSQKKDCFVRSVRMTHNGQIQLYYLTSSYKSLSSLADTLNAGEFVTLVNNLFTNVLDVRDNGFLSCKNIDISFDRIYVDLNTFKVRLVYLPLKAHLFDDEVSFENELKAGLVRLIASGRSLNSPQVLGLAADLQNGLFALADVKKRMSHLSSDGMTASFTGIYLSAYNTPSPFEIFVNKPEFLIGQAKTNDAAITFDRTVSRVHCKISFDNGDFRITDLQSKNGTFLNRERLRPKEDYVLKNGDTVRISDIVFTVRIR